MVFVVAVTGTPGTGKTTLARFLEGLGLFYVDVNSLLRVNGLCEEFDVVRDCVVVDENKFSDLLVEVIKRSRKPLVVDSLLSHHIFADFVSVCVVTVCDIPVLEKRLKERGYSSDKIAENLDAERFQTSLVQARDVGHKVVVFDTSRGVSEVKGLLEEWSSHFPLWR